MRRRKMKKNIKSKEEKKETIVYLALVVDFDTAKALDVLSDSMKAILKDDMSTALMNRVKVIRRCTGKE